MMYSNKIKVVWTCAVMNHEIRDRIGFRIPFWKRLLTLRRRYNKYDEIAIWNTNAIRCFEKYDDVELHVILLASNMLHAKEEFEIRNVKYHVLRDDGDYFFQRIKYNVISYLVRLGVLQRSTMYHYNRRRIKSIIDGVNPDIIHIIGAENFNYSFVILDIPQQIPVIVQLQTLLSAPNIAQFKPYLAQLSQYERIVLRKARYIGTIVPYYKEYVQADVNPNATILPLQLAIEEETAIIKDADRKIYDFVYFSSNIIKGVDLAIEAFALAHNKYPKLSLDIIGGYDEQFKQTLDMRLSELNIKESVVFEGRLPSHEDVINQIRQAKFALLPIRTDFIPGVIREAIANYLPVVTTITPGTPTLNERRNSVLLSKTGDHQTLADNMIRLVEDEALATDLIENALLTIKEKYNNDTAMEKWRKQYYTILSNL